MYEEFHHMFGFLCVHIPKPNIEPRTKVKESWCLRKLIHLKDENATKYSLSLHNDYYELPFLKGGGLVSGTIANPIFMVIYRAATCLVNVGSHAGMQARHRSI